MVDNNILNVCSAINIPPLHTEGYYYAGSCIACERYAWLSRTDLCSVRYLQVRVIVLGVRCGIVLEAER
jgi:hypothetical protein